MEGVLGVGANVPGFAVYDASGPAASRLMYAVDDEAPTDLGASGSNLLGSLQVGGRTWSVQVGDSGQALSTAQVARPIGVVAIGTILALLVAAVVRATRVPRLAAERLAAARRSELDALTAAAGDAIITVGLDGCITGWNEGGTRIFGYRDEEIFRACAHGRHAS